VLLSEFRAGDVGVFKKVAANATVTEPTSVDGAPALWLTGAPHLFLFPDAPPRLAGNVLLWLRSGLTLRLEGRLTQAQAEALARTIR
jgi:hypothetical protein